MATNKCHKKLSREENIAMMLLVQGVKEKSLEKLLWSFMAKVNQTAEFISDWLKSIT